MLSQPISTVLPQIHKNLKQLYGEQLDKLILFGSQARGTAQTDSDIDILIVLKDVFNYSQESEKISQIIADLCLEYNVLISCAFATSEQLENYNSGFFRNVRQDGLLI
ncbi:MAG: nucleotidyltransferase domain-containing protein [Nostoc sp.]|uniref:nucleotidyltransferase domain-containing protein n=1 Tax=Nostoc sp. TaxID=1180 RepID=UPI002FF9BF26